MILKLIGKLLLVFLISQTIAQECQHEEQRTNAVCMLLKLKLSESAGISKNMDSIVFLGGTGTGKSTLINLLAGYKLDVISSQILGDKRYQVHNISTDQIYTEIGQSVDSQTLIPIHVPSKIDRNTAFFDTAGFSETRGFFKEVIHHFGIQLMLNITYKVKLVIVIDQLGLKNNKLREIIHQLGLNDQFSNSVGLIISKVQAGSTQEDIRNLLHREISLLQDSGLKGISLIKTAFALQNYAIFSTPERVQQMKTTLEKQRIKIQKMIKGMTFSKAQDIKMILTIPPNYIMLRKLQEAKKQVSRKHLNDSVMHATRSLIRLNFDQSFVKLNETKFFEKMFLPKYLGNNPKWLEIYKIYYSFYQYLDKKTQASSRKSLIKLYKTRVYESIINYLVMNPQQKGFWRKIRESISNFFGLQ